MKILQKITVFYLGFLSIILPLKFASLTMMPEATSYFPAELWEYLIINFPGASTGMATGTGLMLSMIAFGGEFFQRKIFLNWTLVAWLAAFSLSLLGFFNASTGDYPLMATAHIAGFLSYGLSMYIYCITHENSFQRILTWWTVGVLLVLAAGLQQYFQGFDDQLAFYYSEKFLMNTTVNGAECTGKTVKEVENMMQTSVEEYVLTLEERHVITEEIEGVDIGIKYNGVNVISDAMAKQNSFLWVNSLFKKNNIKAKIDFEYDTEKLDETIGKLECLKEEFIHLLNKKQPIYVQTVNAFRYYIKD